jgi:DNA-binding transcriptional ArsR family regulator
MLKQPIAPAPTLSPTMADVAQLRLASSPLLELVMSFRALINPEFDSLYRNWIEMTRQIVDVADYPLMSAMIAPSGSIPDFMTPTPTQVQLDIEVEFERVLKTPPDVVRRDIEMLINGHGPYCIFEDEPLGSNATRQQAMMYPHEFVPCLVEEMRDYWQRALAQHWSRMIAVLENDILYRSRHLTVNGIETMVNNLMPSISYIPGQIKVAKCLPKRSYSLSFEEEGLQLVPVIFSGNHVYHQITPEWKRMIIYTARGAGLWQYELPRPSEALELTLGIGKARLLVALQSPLNTGELAHKLILTAGAVSQQLKNLQQAGLVESFRSGKNVYHRLTLRGEKLMELF